MLTTTYISFVYTGYTPTTEGFETFILSRADIIVHRF